MNSTDWSEARTENRRLLHLHSDLLKLMRPCGHRNAWTDGARGECPRCMSVRVVAQCKRYGASINERGAA